MDSVKAAFGDDFFDRSAPGQSRHVWHDLCVCGHLDRYHSPNVGGTYRIPGPRPKMVRGEEITVSTVFHGCVGALKSRGFEEVTATADREALTVTEKINATCPCEDFQPVARVDRPNRYFNQRMPLDRTDPVRHPFLVGIRAFGTHLSRRKPALENPAWATAEFDRRFTWLDDGPVCDLSECTSTDDVWPVFVTAEGRSELRCAAHR